MKKILVKVLLCCLAFNMFSIKVEAQEELGSLQNYENIIEKVNEDYNQNFRIMNEEEYYASSYCDFLGKDYEHYILNILQTDLDEFENQLIDAVILENEINVTVELNARSVSGSKTVYFNSSRNTMTLKYKYSGSTYDTSYTPTATVAKVSSTSWFEMSSYTGSFKNSNTTYTVVAKGNCYTTTGVTSNQSFTVNFNL